MSPSENARAPVANQFDADEESAAAHIADFVELGQSLADGGLKLAAHGSYALEQAVAFDDVLHGESRRARGGVSAEGVPGHVRAVLVVNGRRDAFADQRRAQRNVAAGQSLGDAHDVGNDALILERAPRAAAARTAHDFVGDQ
jgi:hypothetical protein